MTPGAYIRLRREAAGLTAAGVEAELGDSVTQLGAALEFLEADRVKATYADARLLGRVFPISPAIVSELGCGTSPAICRGCGCSEFDPCDEGGRACAWAEPDLCTSCLPDPAPPGATALAA
ncbi:MAG TPA: hypothetical protein VF605_11810 [Allosphingosinicella sp.]|jgi:hypothetical protein